MAENQKYYYMRLRADFFNRKDIILLESMQNGAVYCLILLKLLTASLENNGHLMLNEEIVMTPAMLATITRYDVGTVEKGKCSVGLRKFSLSHPFSQAKGTDNVIQFTTSRYHNQPLVVQGPGAGPEVTAAGIFADILRLSAYLGSKI